MARRTQGRIFQRGKKGTYYLQYYVNNKEVKRRLLDENGNPVTNKRDAEKARDRELAPIKTSDHQERRRQVADAYRNAKEVAEDAKEKAKPKLPLSDVWKKYPYTYSTRGKRTGNGKRRALSESSVRDNKQQWDKFVSWCKTHLPDRAYAEDITEQDAQAYSQWLRTEEKVSNNRHNKLIYCAGVMLKAATGENPFRNVDLWEEETTSHTDATPNEVSTAIENATGEQRRLLLIGALTGLRLGDAVFLTWGDNIAKDLTELRRETSKSKAFVRFDLHPWLATELATTPPQERHGYICPNLAKEYSERKPQVSRRLSKHLSDHALIEGKEQCRLTFYSLRAAFATVCAQAGVPIDYVQRWLGHSCPTVTRIYDRTERNPGSEQIAQALSNAYKLTDGNKSNADGEGDAKLREQAKQLIDYAPIEQVRQFIEHAESGESVGNDN